jgi:hypothetical protein
MDLGSSGLEFVEERAPGVEIGAGSTGVKESRRKLFRCEPRPATNPRPPTRSFFRGHIGVATRCKNVEARAILRCDPAVSHTARTSTSAAPRRAFTYSGRASVADQSHRGSPAHRTSDTPPCSAATSARCSSLRPLREFPPHHQHLLGMERRKSPRSAPRTNPASLHHRAATPTARPRNSHPGVRRGDSRYTCEGADDHHLHVAFGIDAVLPQPLPQQHVVRGP